MCIRDSGKPYPTYTKEMCDHMKDLVCYADILTPNMTEACILTAVSYTHLDVYKRQPRENIQAVLSTCHDFIDHFDEQSRNLLFYGDTGVGKTFLTNCIARELLDASHTVIYLTAFHLVDILQNNTFGNDDMDDLSLIHILSAALPE